uniref:U3 small nucleolar RNA-associated protein 18 homolog n=1 Tax=Hirondellea gigas TaxID=1518452 RepID=A0A6A7G3B9_9CRUS
MKRSGLSLKAKAKQKKRFKSAEEKTLENLIFGNEYDSVDHFESVPVLEDLSSRIPSSDDDSDTEKAVRGSDQPSPSWFDSDDETTSVDISQTARLRKLRKTPRETSISGVEYSARLRSLYLSLHPTPEWACIPKGEQTDETSLLQTSDSLITSPTTLQAGVLEITRLKDANIQDYSQGVVTTTEFHPNGQLLLVSAMDKTLRIFQVDGLENEKIQGIMFDGTPIHCSRFSPDGTQVIVSARRKFFYSYDVQSGKVERIPQITGRDEKSLERFEISPDGSCIAFLGNNGYIILVSLRTRQPIGTLKMNGSVRSIAFTSDGLQLYSIGGDGEVYVWNMKTRECVFRHRDHGCVSGTCIAVSPCGQYYATGSESGVVNLYSNQTLSNQTPVPLKSVNNLTTPIDGLKFNHSSEILGIFSSRKRESLRMLHVNSRTIFSNWPTSSTPLHYVNCLDFSPSSRMVAIGNARGKVLLYRLCFYDL